MRTRLRAVLAVALVALLGVITIPTQSPAEAETTQQAFIRSLVPAAQENQRRTGIPASVAIGQAALETGWGRSSMAKPPMNTLFNIKCTKTPSPFQSGCADVPSYEYNPDGSRYLVTSSFRTYATTGDSVLDYGRLLTTAARYKPAFQYTNNPDEFIRAIRRGGYATDPQYAEIVISIMKRYDLYRYDKPGSAGLKPVVPQQAAEDWKPRPTPTGGKGTAKEFVDGASYPALAMGMQGQSVRTLQALLNEHNSAGLKVDGRFGKGTDAAVRNWQNRVGVKATGVMDDASWAPLLTRLKQGAKGTAVRALQEELRQHGQKVSVSGTFDASTTAAVKALQDHHKIRPNGEVGPTLWARLLDW